MIDRLIRFIALALLVLVVFIAGYMTALWSAPSPAPIAAAQQPVAAVATTTPASAAPRPVGPPGLDVPVRRVRTVPVRPLDTSGQPAP